MASGLPVAAGGLVDIVTKPGVIGVNPKTPESPKYSRYPSGAAH